MPPQAVVGRLHSGRPVHMSPLFFPINTGETKRAEVRAERRENEERREKRVEERERKKKQREEERRKTKMRRKNREKGRRKNREKGRRKKQRTCFRFFPCHIGRARCTSLQAR